MSNLLQIIKNHFVVIILGGVVLYLILSQYKSSSELYHNYESQKPSKKSKQSVKFDDNEVSPLSSLDNHQYASAQGTSTSTHGLPPSCTPQQTINPSDLLPRDVNSQWAQLNPSGAGDLKGVNLLSAGALIGIDTIGNSLRNANLQIRSEPPNPQLNVGPWNNTTISPDLMRVPLEIGCGSQ
jgi:hypothetical protein